MRLILFLFAIMVSTGVFCQHQYNVFNWQSELTLNKFLLQHVHQQYNGRREILQTIASSPFGITTYRDSCRVRYKKLLGEFPQKTDLKPQIIGTIKKKGYEIEKIIYESIDNHHVTANLYIPEGKGPFPGILLFCGHEAESKATESYQRTAILFALNGFVVFIVDPISQGERYQITDNTGKPITRGGTTEHTLINAAANLVGSSVVAYELWDNLRGLDYLITRPEVDNDRIGCLGNSGGGTQAAYFIGFDERIKVAAVCSFVASRERNFDLIGANDGCQHVPGEGKAKLEISDFLVMFAPKPLLILAGRYDFVDYTGTQHAHQELKMVYEAFKQQDKIKLFTADDGHGISKPKRAEAVSWFRKWLYKDTMLLKEVELHVLPPKELQCTATGQVRASYPNEVNDIRRSQIVANSLKQNRSRNKGDLKTVVKAVLNISANRSDVISEDAGQVIMQDQIMHKIILRRESELPVPLLLVYPSRRVAKVVLLLPDKGKHHIADSTALLKNYLAENAAIIMADLGGLGELADPGAFNDPKYFNVEYRNALTAIHIGSSLTAERVKNIILLLDFISGNEKLRDIPIHLHAEGKAAIAALHAAVMDKRITELNVYEMISSFEEVFQRPDAQDWYSYVVPGALKYYDIPDLKEALAGRFVK